MTNPEYIQMFASVAAVIGLIAIAGGVLWILLIRAVSKSDIYNTYPQYYLRPESWTIQTEGIDQTVYEVARKFEPVAEFYNKSEAQACVDLLNSVYFEPEPDNEEATG